MVVEGGEAQDADINPEVPPLSEESEDEEIILQVKSGVSELSEEEIDRDLSESQRQNAADNRRLNELKRNREHIKRIDLEMKQRIQELHTLISDGGLVESAQMLEKMDEELTMSNGEQDTMVRQRQQEPQHMSNKLINSNSNAVVLGLSNRVVTNRSEETIYKNAVPKRNSSSSEDEPLNLSDESVEPSVIPQMIDQLIISGRQEAVLRNNEPQPGCSYQQVPLRAIEAGNVQQVTSPKAVDPMVQFTPEERARQIVQEAERAKAKIYSTKGNDMFNLGGQLVNSAIVDENYMVVGNHIDEGTVKKIVNGEYVDFGKLIPRDRILAEEDGRMEMVVRSGKMYWMPVNDAISINGFSRWEQAFRIFSNIYTKAYPQRSTELIQYNHIIHTVSMSYMWDNVYAYDKEFRIHMSRNPGRSWSVILQQAWSMRLKYRLHRVENSFGANRGSYGFGSQGSGDRAKVNEPCRRFNRGKCNFGPGCKYEHCCLNCNKFGHGILTCRRLSGDRDRNSGGRPGGARPNPAPQNVVNNRQDVSNDLSSAKNSNK